MTTTTTSIDLTSNPKGDLSLGVQKMNHQTLSQQNEDPVYESLDSFAACFCCNPFENFLPDFIQVQGSAFDVIVVKSSTSGRVASNDFRVIFDHPTTPFPPRDNSVDTEQCEALLEVVDEQLGKVYFPIDHNTIRNTCRLRGTPKSNSMTRSLSQSSDGDGVTEQETLQLLAKLLKPGRNDVRYLLRTESRVLGMALASVYLWDANDKLVVCDVDGTITKSNIRGIYDTIVAEKYVHCHERVCHFLTRIKNGGREHHDDENPQEDKRSNVNILYLSSRPLAIANSTRRFLSKVRQSTQSEVKPRRGWSKRKLEIDDATPTSDSFDEEHRLPDGPLIGFPGPLSEVLKMEMVTHSVHLFKASTLLEQVVAPFCNASGSKDIHKTMFIAGFGNTMMDVQAYHMAGMELSQIYLIDKKSRISCLDAGLVQQKDFKERTKSTTAIIEKGSDNTFLIVDDPLPGEKDYNNPVLRTPLKCYRKEFGTMFRGYHDEAIVLHVFSDKVKVLA